MKTQIVVIPDIQFYTGEPEYYPVLEGMTEWILARKEQVAAVLQLGDLTNHNTETEWARARAAFAPLDGVLPYFLAVGNHDLGSQFLCSDRQTHLNEYFKLGQNSLNCAAVLGCFCAGEMENVLYEVGLGGERWQVLVLEFGPREEVVEWAKRVLSEQGAAPTLLVTHDFIDHYSTLFTPDGSAQRSQEKTPNSPHSYPIAEQAGGVNCGEELWEKLVKQTPQIRLALNGHHKPYARDQRSGEVVDQYYFAQSRRSDRRQGGSIFHQILFNAQWEPRGGNGLMLLLEFAKEGVEARTVSSEIEVSEQSVPAPPEGLFFDLDF